jgi:hypothetical protein
MNEQLQGKLVEILSGIQAATKAAGDFALEQLPDIAQQYVFYGRAISTFYLVASMILLSVMLVVCVKFGFANTKAVKSDGYDKGDWLFGRMLSAMLGSAGSLLSFVFLCESIGRFALVWFAPKVWLLKEIASLIK